MVAWALGRLIAAVFALFAVVLFAVAIWNSAGQSTVLNADTYKDGLASQNIYEDIIPVALPALARSSSAPQNAVVNFNDITEAIGSDNWRAIANDLVPPDWLQQQVEQGIDLTFAWIHGDTDAALVESFDLKSLHERLTGEEGKQAVDRVIRSAPACTDAQLEQIRTLEKNSGGKLPICQPPKEYFNVTRTVLSSALNVIASQIRQDQYSLAEVIGLRQRSDNLQAVTLGAQIYYQLTCLFYLCPVGLVALMVAFAVRSFKGFGRWAGIVLVLAGLLAILPLPLISIELIDSVSDVLVNDAQDPEVQLFQFRLATGLVESAFGQFSSPVVSQGGLFVAGGILLWITTMVAGAFQRQQAPVPINQMPSTANQPRTVTISGQTTSANVDIDSNDKFP
jgi:hypothetical protein